MKRFLMLFTILLTCMSLFATVAEARRLGGGTSFGKQRAIPTQQQQKVPAAAPAPAPSTPATAPTGNRWLGPLAGLAIGAGLASMFAGGGMGAFGSMMGPLLMILLVAGIAMFMLSRFKKSQQPATPFGNQFSGAQFNQTPQPTSFSGSYASLVPPVTANIPHDFPVDSFLRNGKTSFIRLQAANDRKDLDDIREYTTPEMFAEISMQTQERGDAVQKTDVLALNAELLEVATEGDYSIASVRFTGQLSENKGVPENVDEIWHVQKNLRDAKAVWLLAGIQQA